MKTTSTAHTKTTLLFTALLLVLAALFLIQGMADYPLWTDESWYIKGSQEPLSVIQVMWEQDIHPPLHTLLLHAWYSIAPSDQVFSPRMISLLLSLLTAAVTARLALDLFDGKAAFAAIVILLTSEFFLLLGIAARQYSLYIMLAALTNWLYWRGAKRGGRGWSIGYWISSVALLYTLYWGGFILLAQGIHCLIFFRSRWKWIVASGIVIGLLFLPWVPNILASTSDDFGGNIEDGYRVSMGLDEDGITTLLALLAGTPIILFVGLALAGLARNFEGRERRDFLPDRHTALPGLWVFTPLVIPVIVTLLGFQLLPDRPMVGMVPGVALLVGHLISQLERPFYVVLLGIAFVTGITVAPNYEFPDKEAPWWDVGAELKSGAAPQDLIVLDVTTRVFAVELHIREAKVPAREFIRYQQIELGWFSENVTPFDGLMTMVDAEAVWLVEYWPQAGIEHHLNGMGFVQTTPSIEFPPFFDAQAQIRRYAYPPTDDPLVTFGDNLRLRVLDHFQGDETLGVRLTWDTLEAPDKDYTVSVFLLDQTGFLVTQDDSFPLQGRSPTSGWTPGEFYFDSHNLDLDGLSSGTYSLGLGVYYWQDGVNLRPEPCSDPDCKFVLVGEVNISD